MLEPREGLLGEHSHHGGRLKPHPPGQGPPMAASVAPRPPEGSLTHSPFCAQLWWPLLCPWRRADLADAALGQPPQHRGLWPSSQA